MFQITQLLRWFEYACPMGSSIIRRCSLVGVGVALLEEVGVSLWRWALRSYGAALPGVDRSPFLASYKLQSPLSCLWINDVEL